MYSIGRGVLTSPETIRSERRGASDGGGGAGELSKPPCVEPGERDACVDTAEQHRLRGPEVPTQTHLHLDVSVQSKKANATSKRTLGRARLLVDASDSVCQTIGSEGGG
jgi:hypothetical protein